MPTSGGDDYKKIVAFHFSGKNEKVIPLFKFMKPDTAFYFLNPVKIFQFG
jgi:hypothetical protein